MDLNNLYSIAILFIAGCFAGIVTRKLPLAIVLFIILSIIGWVICTFLGFDNMKWMCVGQLFSIIAFLILISKSEDEITEDVYTARIKDKKGRSYYVKGIDKGVGIFGASGSGKSESVIQSLLQHYAKFKFSGIINDHKNFELSSVAKEIFENNGIEYNVFALHRPDISVRVNPISPNYMKSIDHIKTFVENYILNVLGSPNTNSDPLWRNAPEGILIGMIWRLKTEFPILCNLPFIAAILVQPDSLHQDSKKFGNLIDFLKVDYQSAISASSFLTSCTDDKLLTSIYTSLTNCLKVIDTPSVAYLLSKDEYNLNFNEVDNAGVLAVVNRPSTSKAQVPINAMIVDIMTGLIDEKKRPIFVMIDEAPTIKINGLPERVATLRSNGVSFGFCVQDLVQGKMQYDGKDYVIKSTTTNLSNMFLGKTNDSGTAKYYEGFFDYKDKEQYSYSKGSLLSRGEQRVNKSFKEQRSVRDYEFMQLKPGEFFMLSGGKHTRIYFKHEVLEKFDYKNYHTRVCNQDDLSNFAKEMFELAGLFINLGWKYENHYRDIATRFLKLINKI